MASCRRIRRTCITWRPIRSGCCFKACCGSTASTGGRTSWCSRCSWRPPSAGWVNCDGCSSGWSSHVGATYLGEGYLYWRIQEAASSPRLIDARDIGVSYFVVGIVGVLTYHIPPRWRWLYLDRRAGGVVGVSLAVKRDFTQLGHFSALLRRAGVLSAEPGRPTRARGCVDSGLWRSATTTSNTCAAAWNSPVRRSTAATNRSARSWSTPTVRRCSRTATASRTATTPAIPSSRSRGGRWRT